MKYDDESWGEAIARNLGLLTLLLVPNLLLAVYLSQADSPFVIENILRFDLGLSRDGEATVDLSKLLVLPLQAYPRVSVSIPRGVHVLAVTGAHGDLPRPVCSEGQCVLAFEGLTGALGTVRLRFDSPGTYTMRIARSRSAGRRKETLVMHTSGVGRPRPYVTPRRPAVTANDAVPPHGPSDLAVKGAGRRHSAHVAPGEGRGL